MSSARSGVDEVLLAAIADITVPPGELLIGTGKYEAWALESLKRWLERGGISLSEKSNVTEEMVNRFLSWRLPVTFAPDCGISFKPINHPDALTHLWPTGTNLLTATEARQMLEHVLGGKS